MDIHIYFIIILIVVISTPVKLHLSQFTVYIISILTNIPTHPASLKKDKHKTFKLRLNTVQ